MAKKKNREEFQRLCGEMLLALGAVPGTYRSHRLETVAGGLECTPYENWLACCFDDPKRASNFASGTSLNPHSGKWNWHFDEPGLKEAVGLFARIASLVPVSEGHGVAFEPAPEGQAVASLNTELTYQYRDGSNYKTAETVVFRGVGAYSLQHLSGLIHACDRSNGRASFIPGMVGLPDLQDSFDGCESHWDPEDDGPWHEIQSVALTTRAPTLEVTWSEFVDRVCSLRLLSGWDEGYKPAFYPIMEERRRALQRETQGSA